MNISPITVSCNVKKNVTNKQQSFSGNPLVARKLPLLFHETKQLAEKFLQGTSGCRGKYGKELTLDHLKMLGLGFAATISSQCAKPSVMLGGDKRLGTQEAMPMLTALYRKMGVSVISPNTDAIPTPIHSYTCMTEGINGTLLTASHNPWADVGMNFVTKEGAIAPTAVNQNYANRMLEFHKKGYYRENLADGGLTKVDMFPKYEEFMTGVADINWDMIRNSGISIHYDGLHGAGTEFVERLFAEKEIPINIVNSTVKEGPNPTSENLPELKAAVKADKSPLKIGLANDGDADRFGLVDENGTFIHPNEVLLLLAYHLKNNKGRSGAIIKSHATTDLLSVFAENNGLKIINTAVGFKNLAEKALEEQKAGKPVTLAGEESGGMTFGEYLPEKDGIVAISLLAELVAKEKRPISKILAEIRTSLGVECYADNISKKIEDPDKFAQIQKNVSDLYNVAISGQPTIFDNYGLKLNIPATKAHAANIEQYKKGGDGVKFIFGDKSSLLIRKSGTEPKSRGIIEAIEKNEPEAKNIFEKLSAVFTEIMQ